MADEATSTTGTATGTATETSGDSATEGTSATERQTTQTTTGQAAATEGEAALGDAGKKALDAMKADRNKARSEAEQLRADFDAFKAKAEGKEAEFAAAQEAQRVKDEALAGANQRILKAEIRATAAGKLSDPADALRFLDLSEFEVSSDGEVDSAAVTSAIDDLISKKPYLAAQGGTKFQGSADGGTRNGSGPSIDQQIDEATKAGNHVQAIALKQQRAALLAEKKS